MTPQLRLTQHIWFAPSVLTQICLRQTSDMLETKSENLPMLPPHSQKEIQGGLVTREYYKNSYADKPLVSITG